MILLDKNYLQIRYDEKSRLLTEEWKNHYGIKVEGELFINSMQVLLQAFKDNQLDRILCDTTERKTLDTKEEVWLEQNFYPVLLKNGLKKIALVDSKDVLGTGVAKNMLQNLITKLPKNG
ncbi:MAG: hypothetical protein EAZ55_11065 [Cytophagales bacterium]|nr:MAG: hypothetical protein EAZ55_11065 [Cytophagales bacterium]